MATNHQIDVRVADNGEFSYSPDPQNLALQVGDTINFSSKQGTVAINFDPPELFSPATCGTGREAAKMTAPGPFDARCTLTVPAGAPDGKPRKFGWPEDKSAGASGVIGGGKGGGTGP